jgi:hypothetical protein
MISYWDDQIKQARWTGNVAHVEEMSNAYRILAGKPDRKDHMVDIIDG